MEDNQKKPLIEALLFLSGEPLTTASIKGVTEIGEAEIKGIIEDLTADYSSRDGGVMITEVAGGYQMCTNPRFAPWVKKMHGAQLSGRLSLAALETLAIIAYKQPLIKAEVEQIRGVNSDGVIKNLLDRRLIKIIGKKEAPGKPMLYGTTREFLQYFGLNDLSDLPTIREFAREEAI